MKKKVLVIAALAFLLGGACIQANKHGGDSIETIVSTTLQKGDYHTVIKKDFDASAVKSMDVQTVSADVEVIGDAAGKATVEVLAKGPNNKSLSAGEIQQRLDKYYRIITELNGSQLKVKVEFKTNHIGNNEGLSLQFILHTPAAATANISAVSGDVELSGAAGVKIATTSGDIKVKQVAGDLTVTSVSGDVQAQSVRGDFSGVTTSGDIEATGVGTFTSAATVSGDIAVTAGNLGKDVKVRTTSGDVKIQLMDKVGIDLKVGTLSGDLDLDGLGAVSYSSKSSNHVVAQVNGGGKSLNVNTISGDIQISKS